MQYNDIIGYLMPNAELINLVHHHLILMWRCMDHLCPSMGETIVVATNFYAHTTNLQQSIHVSKQEYAWIEQPGNQKMASLYNFTCFYTNSHLICCYMSHMGGLFPRLQKQYTFFFTSGDHITTLIPQHKTDKYDAWPVQD